MTSIWLPIWLLWYISPSLHPHPRWTYRQAVMNSILNAFLYHWSLIEIEWPRALSVQDRHGISHAGRNKVFEINGNPDNVVLCPSQSHPATGPKQMDGVCNILAQSTIKPERVAGIWYRSTQAQSHPRKGLRGQPPPLITERSPPSCIFTVVPL